MNIPSCLERTDSRGRTAGKGDNNREHLIQPVRETRRSRGFSPAAHLLLALGDAGGASEGIQELAGHADLSTTQRYMHLSPAAIESAIRLLDDPGVGETGETGLSRGRAGPPGPGNLAWELLVSQDACNDGWVVDHRNQPESPATAGDKQGHREPG